MSEVAAINTPVTPPAVYVKVLLDGSGSMMICLDATISGFNEYIHGLKQDTSTPVYVSLVKFDSDGLREHKMLYDTIFEPTLVSEVPQLTTAQYMPRGGTPLRDAVAHTIGVVEQDLKLLPPGTRVIINTMTDGGDNTSKEFKKPTILAEMVKRKEAEQGWSFTYLGANQDAWAVASEMGFSSGNTRSYAVDETLETFLKMSRGTRSSMNRAYAAGITGQSLGATTSFFNDEEEDVAKGVYGSDPTATKPVSK